MRKIVLVVSLPASQLFSHLVIQPHSHIVMFIHTAHTEYFITLVSSVAVVADLVGC